MSNRGQFPCAMGCLAISNGLKLVAAGTERSRFIIHERLGKGTISLGPLFHKGRGFHGPCPCRLQRRDQERAFFELLRDKGTGIFGSCEEAMSDAWTRRFIWYCPTLSLRARRRGRLIEVMTVLPFASSTRTRAFSMAMRSVRSLSSSTFSR